MKAYVELIQRKERDIGCDVLTHQKVSPSLITSSCSANMLVVRSRFRRFNDDDYYWWNVSPVDLHTRHELISRSSTAAMGKGVTESQFVDDKAKKALENL